MRGVDWPAGVAVTLVFKAGFQDSVYQQNKLPAKQRPTPQY
jgi:hypothetical protein